jgi:hypothetical protein
VHVQPRAESDRPGGQVWSLRWGSARLTVSSSEVRWERWCTAVRTRSREKSVAVIEHPDDAIVRFSWRQFADPTAPLLRADARHQSVTPSATNSSVSLKSGFFGADREARGPGDGALQHLLGSCVFCARGLYLNCHNVHPNATVVGGIYLAKAEVPGAAVAVRRRCGPQERQAR